MTKPSKFISAGGIEEVKRLIREKRSVRYIAKKFDYASGKGFSEALKNATGFSYMSLYKQINKTSFHELRSVISADQIKLELNRYRDLKDIGEDYSLDPATLRRIFKKKFAITPRKYKTKIRNGIY